MRFGTQRRPESWVQERGDEPPASSGHVTLRVGELPPCLGPGLRQDGPDPTANEPRSEVSRPERPTTAIGLRSRALADPGDGEHGIYLEDLFVRPKQRGSGLGRPLLAEPAAECVRKGYSHLQWWVVDLNEPAIGFYRLHAEPMDNWTTYRLSGHNLTALATDSPIA